MDLDALKEHLTTFKGKRTVSTVTDKHLNIYEEILEDGVYKRTLVGNKKKDGNLTESEAAYYIDTKLCKVIDRLYISSGDAAKKLDVLVANNITHVVNVATNIPNLFPEKFTYLAKDIADIPDAPLLKVLDDVLPFIHEAHKDNGSVLVHCNQGISRSASIIIAYLMKYQKASLAEAVQKTAEARPQIKPNYGFEQQLQKFEKHIKSLSIEISSPRTDDADGESTQMQQKEPSIDSQTSS
ncbi:hypothetical protein MP228_008161 [Amoeboaphelidium protococcarum]|nr:hypothetical protein MP228_008161 [Amoeboaphelidium protococcarum]